MSSATAPPLANALAAQSTSSNFVQCPLDAVVNIPPPRRDWVQLTGPDEHVRLAKLLRHMKPVKWNLPAPIASSLKTISDSGWWIANQFAEAPGEILWPESWVRAPGQAIDTSKAFREALRVLVSFNTDAYKRKHRLCERCHDADSYRVYHIQPKFGAFATVIAEWLGPEEVRRLAAMSQASWPDELRQAILEAHREECRLMALCGSCVPQGNPRPETTTKDS